MEREYLAKYRDREYSDIRIEYYKEDGVIYREFSHDSTSKIVEVDGVPSSISGFEEMGLQDAF